MNIYISAIRNALFGYDKKYIKDTSVEYINNIKEILAILEIFICKIKEKAPNNNNYEENDKNKNTQEQQIEDNKSWLM